MNLGYLWPMESGGTKWIANANALDSLHEVNHEGIVDTGVNIDSRTSATSLTHVGPIVSHHGSASWKMQSSSIDELT